VRHQWKGKGNAAVAGFVLALIAGTWVLGGAPGALLPQPASQFLTVLNTEQVAGEHVSVWERLSAGLVLAVSASAAHRSPQS
jgi:hypothetical protein